jgi:hypothetical protein
MGKTKLLAEVRKSLERINSDLSAEQGKPEFHLFFGVADIANKSQKLHPWRRIFQVRCRLPCWTNCPRPLSDN